MALVKTENPQIKYDSVETDFVVHFLNGEIFKRYGSMMEAEKSYYENFSVTTGQSLNQPIPVGATAPLPIPVGPPAVPYQPPRSAPVPPAPPVATPSPDPEPWNNVPLPPPPVMPSPPKREPWAPVPTPKKLAVLSNFDVAPEQANEVIAQLLDLIEGDAAEREGLADTPVRVVKAWKFWTSGYSKDPAEILKTFEDGAEGCDEMIIVKDIPIYSKCEHHLADIFGTVSIAYIPNGKIVGLSKLSRLADMFARRLQVQERLTSQIADALVEHLDCVGVGVIVKARHMCMESRGICQQGHHTITTALRGAIKDEPATRAEFIAMVS